MYSLSQAVLTCLPPELRGARLFPDKRRGGGRGGRVGRRLIQGLYSAHLTLQSRSQGGVQVRRPGQGQWTWGACYQVSGVHTQTHTHTGNTQTPTPKGTWVPTQLRNNVSMQTRTGVCCVYRSRHRHIYRGCRDVFTHTRTRTNTHAHSSTHKGFRFGCARPNSGGRKRV